MHALVPVLLLFYLQSPSTAKQRKSQPQKQIEDGQHVSEPSAVTVNVTQIPSQNQAENPQANKEKVVSTPPGRDGALQTRRPFLGGVNSYLAT